MRILAVASQKGGVGKTSAVVNIGAALAEFGERVLAIDLDPQANASHWLGATLPQNAGIGADAIFTGNGTIASIARNTSIPGVDVIAASPWLLGMDKRLAAEIGAETLLRKALQHAPRGRWDWCLIDCPPALGLLTVNALAAASGVLVPVEAHPLALRGLAALGQAVERVRETLNPRLRIEAILACRVRPGTNLAREALESLRRRFGSKLLKTSIRETVRVPEASGHAQPVTTYAPRCTAAEDYRAAAAELLDLKRRR